MWFLAGGVLYVFGVVGAVHLALEDGDTAPEAAIVMGLLWPLMLPYIGVLHLMGWED